ncbi:diguanylate cyclase [Sulfurimonas sp.]
MNKNFLPILALLIVAIFSVFVVSDYVEDRIIDLRDKQYKQEASSLKKRLTNLIEAKKKATMAIAISLSENTTLKEALKNTDNAINLGSQFKQLSSKLRQYTDYKNVWIQIINSKGISVSRSWIDKRGDSLINVRTDIKKMISTPQIMNTISTGKFSMTFKSMVPVFDDEKNFLGFIETITHFNSIVKELEKINVSSLVLVDKKYKNQLSKSITNKFAGDYYIANFNSDQKKVKSLQEKGIEYFVNLRDYVIYKDYFIATNIIKDIHNDDMGFYILMKHVDSFEYDSINDFVNSIRIVVLIGLLLATITVLIFYKRKYDIEKQRTYFKDIIDSTSDIIIITDTKHPLDVNKSFFEFFDSFKTLEEFEKEHGCVCNLFEKEDGFLQKEMGEYTWVEYVFHHKNIEHKVKIINKQKEYIFSVHIKELNESGDKTYTLVLTDITKMKAQQDKLEYLSHTDALTNIGNRKYFNQNISREIEISKRYANNLSLIMLDLDNFKQVNDTYGHDIGDIVLVEFTKAVQNLLRKTDIFCRYGGEEFIIIIPGDTSIKASIFAERIRTHIEKLKISSVEKVTVSIGVTEFKKEDTVETLIKRTDIALYQSKNNGRNCITSI